MKDNKFITHAVVCAFDSEEKACQFCLDTLGAAACRTLCEYGLPHVLDASTRSEALTDFLASAGCILYLDEKCPDLADGELSLFIELSLTAGGDGTLISPSGKVIAVITSLRLEPGQKLLELVGQPDIQPRATASIEPITKEWQATKRGHAYMERMLERLCEYRGAVVISPDGIVISPRAQIGRDVTLYPNVQIYAGSVIGDGCTITSGSVINNSVIGNHCTVNATQIYDSTLGEGVKIGPFCHVRPNSHIGDGCKIGDFVEVKNSNVGEGTHISHLTYVGDSDVGKRVNFGCGTVTVNYDGRRKHRTVIGDDAFIGCNTNLVAPVKVGEGAYTGAGSTITSDVPPYALAISRVKEQRIIEDWVKNRK